MIIQERYKLNLNARLLLKFMMMRRTLILAFLLSLLFSRGFEINCLPSEDKDLQCSGFQQTIADEQSNCQKHLIYITVPLISSACSPKYVDIFKQMQAAFSGESEITVILRSCPLQLDACNFSVTHYGPVPVDRVCLMKSPHPSSRIRNVLEGDNIDVSGVLNFTNTHTKSNRHLNGTITKYGIFLNDILNNQYKVPILSESAPVKCDRISFETLRIDPLDFILKYFIRQRPVVIQNFPSIHNSDRNTNFDKTYDPSISTAATLLNVSNT